MRIVHLSDLDVLALDGAVPWRLFNKRATGWLNLKLKREHAHRPALLAAVAARIREVAPDHVVVTGDLSNLSLEGELARVRTFLDDELGLPPEHVSVVPGNHDVYTRGAARSGRFERFFAPYLVSDLPHLATAQPAGRFPFVKLRGPVALIGLSSARPRPPLVASGSLGPEQLAALDRVLAHDAVRSRLPIVLVHHPLHAPRSWWKAHMDALTDADALASRLKGLDRGLLLHGHLHERTRRAVGRVSSLGATSASLAHEHSARVAGFNVYDVADDGTLAAVGAERIDLGTGSFVATDVPHAHT